MSQKVKKYFHDISPRAWEHPADKAALSALRQVPGFDALLKMFIGGTTEKSLRLIALASSVRVSPRQFPRVCRLLEEACAVLDMKEVPELYVSQSPFMNAGAVGVDKAFIILNSAFPEHLSDDELLSVIGHELGHIVSGHVLYKTLLMLLLNVSTLAFQLPLQGLALQAVIAALREWDRKSELSSDRAGLLAVQDVQSCYVLLMKLAGGNRVGEMDINDFFLQAAEYEKGGSVLDSVYKLLNLIGQNHPFPVLRLSELKTWVDSGEYAKIIDGQFPVKADTKDDVFKDFSEAASSYKQHMTSSEDPLAKAFSNLVSGIEGAAKQAENLFGGLFGDKK